jgi:hypothetical protein
MFSKDNVNIKHFFTKFMGLETGDMELETKIKDTYNAIFSTLMEYLKDGVAKFDAKIEADKERFLRSWEGARVAAIKVQGVFDNGVGGQEKKLNSGGLQKLTRKWCGVS